MNEVKPDYLDRVESAFKRVSTLVTARDIFEPFAKWALESDKESDVLKALFEADRLGGPVGVDRDDDIIPGVYFSENAYFDPDDPDDPDDVEDFEMSIADVMETVLNQQLVSGDTTLFELIELFAKGQVFFLVVDRARIVGVVRFADLLKPAARVCLFGMTLEFEYEAMRLCSRFAEQCFESLPKGRQEKAEENFDRRFDKKNWRKYFRDAARLGGDPDSHFLIDCTMLIDKAKMITKCKLTGESHKRIQSVFNRVERLRNTCAHPALVGDAVPQSPKELWELVHDCHDLIDTFRRLRSAPHDSV